MGADPEELCPNVIRDEMIHERDGVNGAILRKIRVRCYCFGCEWDNNPPIGQLMKELIEIGLETEATEKEAEEREKRKQFKSKKFKRN